MDPQQTKVREAAVSGQFYPGSAAGLASTVDELVGRGPKVRAIGVMVPHAGYLYSGAVAGEVFGRVEMPDSFIILGPNHTGLGPAVSVMTEGVWRMPAGDAVIDRALASAVLENGADIEADDTAHTYEHSIEVQLPFLQHIVGQVSFVPITLKTSDPDLCRETGHAVAAAVRYSGNPVLIVASSDMTHYESQEQARHKDQMALERVLELDAEGLLATVRDNNISMCGVAPAAAMIAACLELGATETELVDYRTSGDVTGDYYQVVGYAGVIIR